MQQQQLQQEFFQYFLTKGAPLLTPRHLNSLMETSYHTVEEIFNARYDETYVANLLNQKVFMKTLHDLEEIIAACKRMKLSNKSKGAIIMQDQAYLMYFLTLLFTKEEKKVLEELVSNNFGGKEEGKEDEVSEVDSEEQRPVVEVIGYILKNIFGIGKSKIEEYEEESEDEEKTQF